MSLRTTPYDSRFQLEHHLWESYTLVQHQVHRKSIGMRKTTNRKPAIAYVRVSTRTQGGRGHGLDLQMVRIEAFAREAGFEITETFTDIQSAVGPDSIVQREHVRAAINLSHKERWPIIVDGLDRFARNTKLLEEMVLSGKLKVISAKTGDGGGRAVVMAEAARAQDEAERISRTTKEGLRKARNRGVILGNTKNLAEAQRKGAAQNQERSKKQDQELLPVVVELRKLGKTTAAQIADGLNDRGLRTPRRQRWNAENVRRPLRRVDALLEQRSAETREANPKWGTW
jgi:DNA invertase Pin-like site-specific DNA recombinase